MQSVRLLIGPDVDTNELIAAMTEPVNQSIEESNNSSDKEAKFDGDRQNQLISDTNAIETTLFLQNHEKISLISSLGPADKLEFADIASTSSSCSNQRQCRICLLCNETKRKRLISPCRCNGSIKFAHNSCLVKWIDASSKRVCPAQCELCGYKYRRRSLLSFDPLHLRLPKIGLRDKILNFLFLLLLVIMSFCSWVSLHYLGLSIKRSNAFRASNTLIGEDDVTMFAATILFFVAFFLAVFTQYRAENSILHILVRFWNSNRNWQISEYDLHQDLERQQRKSAIDNRLMPKSPY